MMCDCFHQHTSQQQPAPEGQVRRSQAQKTGKTKSLDPPFGLRPARSLQLPVFKRVVLSQTKEMLKKSWKHNQHSLPPRPLVRGKHVERKKIPGSSNLTMAPTSPFSPFSPGGPGKPCKRRQTNTLSFKEEKVVCSRTKPSVINSNSNNHKKNPPAFKYASVKLINNFETMSMWCYVRQNTLILTEPQSVNTQLVRRDTYYN